MAIIANHQPDIRLITYWIDEDDWTIAHQIHPIIAWHLHDEDAIDPLTPANDVLFLTDNEGWAILYSDGTVAKSGDSWPTVDGFLQWTVRWRREAHERRQQKSATQLQVVR